MASKRDRPGESADESFRALAEELVDGPLRESIAQTNLPADRFVEEAVAQKEGIEEEVALQRETVEILKARLRRQRVMRAVAAIGAVFVIIGLAYLILIRMQGFPYSDSARWGALLLVGVGTALPFLTFALERVPSRRRPRAMPSGASSGTEAPVGIEGLSLADQLRAAEDEYRAARERALQRWLTDLANRQLGEIYEASLPELDPTGLAEIDESEQEIPTDAADELSTAIDHMPGGSIGVSGPRGAGKTTLLRTLTTEAWRKRPEKIRAAIVVDAPVDYDARDFVLHLFGQLCEFVLGAERVEAMRGWQPGFGLPLSRTGLFRNIQRTIPPLLGPGLVAVGAAAYLALLDAQNKLDPADLVPWAIGTMVLGAAFTYLTVTAWLIPSLVRGNLLGLGSKGGDLSRAAERHLRQIWFQRTFSSGWSGSLKVPIGTAGAEKSTQMAENQLSFPDVVALYKDFVRRLAREGQVRIGIDELDKMEDDRARRFLNEIKVAFRISGCFYLVSVSEDAMAYFERRGLPFRDVFDSSFDDVMTIGYLPYADSQRLIRRRVVGMPVQFIALCHVLGGGLPRDVIRAARDVSEGESGKTIAEATNDICVEQLQSKCVAARVAVRRLVDPGLVNLLSRWLSGIDAAAPDAAALLARCGAFEGELSALLEPAPGADAEARKERREALSIALEVATFAYFILTVRELMATLTSPEATRTAIHNEAVDRLAKARQAFSINPGEAWEAISAVRAFPMERVCVQFPMTWEPDPTPA